MPTFCPENHMCVKHYNLVSYYIEGPHRWSFKEMKLGVKRNDVDKRVYECVYCLETREEG